MKMANRPPCPPIMGGSEKTFAGVTAIRVFRKPIQTPPLLGGRGAASCLILLALLPFLTGCPSRTNTNPAQTPAANALTNPADRSAGAFAQTDPWILQTKEYEALLAKRGIYKAIMPKVAKETQSVFIGNGYMGVTWGGTEPLRLRVAGVYEEPGETLSVLSVPHEADLLETTPAKQLDMRHGLLRLEKSPRISIEQDDAVVFCSLDNPHLFVVRRAEGPRTADMRVRDREVVVEKQRKGGVTVAVAEIVNDQDTNYFAAVYTSRDTSNPVTAARNAVLAANKKGYDTLLEAHEAAWQKLWQTADIQIEGDAEAQQLVHKLMFDLLQSTRPGMADSIAPESLSGDFYKGHIFWDAEIWMFPALLAQRPDYAKSILDYRFKHLPQARAIAKQGGYKGADFPWESAASGKEVAPGEFSTERHITADVGWAAWQYYRATGDKAWLKERGWPLISSVAEYWASRAKKNAQTGKYDVNGVVGPDELAKNVNNNTYTNALASDILRYASQAAQIVGQKANPKWADVAKNIALPFDKAKGVYLTRQNDDGAKTKQADGELLFYPVELPMDKKIADATWEYQKGRPIKNGPAMTDSVHALIAARLGRQDEAETYFRESYRPFMRGPFLLFSEKRSLDRCVFTTGAGGVLQSVLYGFGGLDFSRPDGLIQTPPVLPKSWKKLTITGIQRGGKRYTLTVTPEKRTLTLEK